MMCFLKKIFRTGVIATLLVGTAAGAAVFVAGPNRTKAVIDQVHGQVLDHIDHAIDDPTALRAQLREMEKEYPARISQVRGDLAELNEQIRQLDREREIAQRVVELADSDLAALESGFQEATARAEVEGSSRLVSVRVENRPLSVERATLRINQVRNTKIAYANRMADAQHDLAYLEQQSERMSELLLQLENERAQFRSQIQALSRQVDAIARNERLIGLLEKRNRTIEECSRYEAISLDQISGRLAEVRSRQEAELDVLAQSQEQGDYEDLARMQLAGEALEAKVSELGSELRDMPYSASVRVLRD